MPLPHQSFLAMLDSLIGHRIVCDASLGQFPSIMGVSHPTRIMESKEAIKLERIRHGVFNDDRCDG